VASATALYTPEVLALATGLSRYPLSDDLPLRGSARSQSCGSMIELGLALDGSRIARVGLRPHACAIGQAAAAIFAEGVVGMSLAEVAEGGRQVAHWLTGGALPDWPGIGVIATVTAYPARHGAVLLPWRAALSALPTGENGG
jgi:NifU-like protein involved in Fe-S cluster formation